MEEKIQSLKNSLIAANVPHYFTGDFHQDGVRLVVYHTVESLKTLSLEAWGEMVKAAMPANMMFIKVTKSGYQHDGSRMYGFTAHISVSK
ncbi:MAG: hypothetical protein WCI88_07055 [Chloroflexota bacterium]